MWHKTRLVHLLPLYPQFAFASVCVCVSWRSAVDARRAPYSRVSSSARLETAKASERAPVARVARPPPQRSAPLAPPPPSPPLPPNMSNEETSADRNVEIWKIKKLIKSLEMARGWVRATCHLTASRRLCGAPPPVPLSSLAPPPPFVLGPIVRGHN